MSDKITVRFCDMTYDELKAMQQENQQLKARIARLEQALQRYRNEVPLGHQPHMFAHFVDEILDESPQQSLAAIQADAVELIRQAVPAILADCGNSYANKWTENWLQGAKDIGAYDGGVFGKISDLVEAQQLRQQRKENQ